MANKIMVYCKTIDRWFPSIQSAAKFAGVNGWTMGMKMQSSGGFIDANGREYIRKTPMKSKNIYPDYGKRYKNKQKEQHAHRKMMFLKQHKFHQSFCNLSTIKQNL